MFGETLYGLNSPSINRLGVAKDIPLSSNISSISLCLSPNVFAPFNLLRACLSTSNNCWLAIKYLSMTSLGVLTSPDNTPSWPPVNNCLACLWPFCNLYISKPKPF